MIDIEQAIKLAEEYGLDVNKVEKTKGGFFYIDKDGEKKQINPDDFTDDAYDDIESNADIIYKDYIK